MRLAELQIDLIALGEKLASLRTGSLVVVDPITSYLGDSDSHRTSDVRGILEPIGEFAEKYGVAVLAITHPPKAQGSAMNAFTGSLAFVAASRLAFLAIEEPDTERRLLLPVKNNIGAKAIGLGYYIEGVMVRDDIEAPHILWDDAPVDVTADQALAATAASIKDPGELPRAKEFLIEALSNGPVDANDVIAEAKKVANISERTLRRARKDLHVVAKKDGFQGHWTWVLP